MTKTEGISAKYLKELDVKKHDSWFKKNQPITNEKIIEYLAKLRERCNNQKNS